MAVVAADFRVLANGHVPAVPVSTRAANRCGGLPTVAHRPFFNLECSIFFEFSKKHLICSTLLIFELERSKLNVCLKGHQHLPAGRRRRGGGGGGHARTV